MEMHFNNNSFNAEHLWMRLKSAMLDGCSRFVPKLKSSSYPHPKWFNPEIKHLLNCIHSLTRSIKSHRLQIEQANLFFWKANYKP